jgi:predicted lipoprotein with Yx(FWY)xxD motif
MGVSWRGVALGVVSGALLVGSLWGASPASAASQQARTATVVFRAQHISGVRGLVLVEGNGLVVYTFTGDRKGHASNCHGSCAAIWPRNVGLVRTGSSGPPDGTTG